MQFSEHNLKLHSSRHNSIKVGHELTLTSSEDNHEHDMRDCFHMQQSKTLMYFVSSKKIIQVVLNMRIKI